MRNFSLAIILAVCMTSSVFAAEKQKSYTIRGMVCHQETEMVLTMKSAVDIDLKATDDLSAEVYEKSRGECFFSKGAKYKVVDLAFIGTEQHRGTNYYKYEAAMIGSKIGPVSMSFNPIRTYFYSKRFLQGAVKRLGT